MYIGWKQEEWDNKIILIHLISFINTIKAVNIILSLKKLLNFFQKNKIIILKYSQEFR
jgi:uncharacterized membrane protein